MRQAGVGGKGKETETKTEKRGKWIARATRKPRPTLDGEWGRNEKVGGGEIENP